MRIYDHFCKSHDFDRADPILIVEDRALSASELLDLVDQTAHVLLEQGIGEADIVLCALPNTVTHCALLLAASKLGIALASIEPSSPEISVRKLQAELRPAATITPSNTGEASENQRFINALKDAVIITPDDACEKQSAEGCFILCTTSGSTGHPKPIALSQQTKITRAHLAAELYHLDQSSIVLAATPLHHTLAQRLFFIPMILGGKSIILEQFTPQKWIETIAHHSVSFTIAVSSQLKRILEIANAEPASFKETTASLKHLVASSSRCSDETKENLVTRFDCRIHEIYGASEMATISNINITEEWDKRRSVGLPIPGVDVRILNKNGAQLPKGQTGEIAVHSVQAFDGYFKRDALTVASTTNEGYFLTGDLGYLDMDGYLYFQGRDKEIIKTGGISVYPIDIEDAAISLETVVESCCFGVPDKTLGEVPCLLVSVRDNAQGLRRKIRRDLLNLLAPHQQPRFLEVIDEFYRTGPAKIDKRKHAAEFIEKYELTDE